jgi:dihydrofolate synthase/folylpolyglutamate synthase
MLRHQGKLNIPEAALRAAADWAHWPARMQRLSPGPLTDLLSEGSELWIDGAHNPSAAAPVARALRTIAKGRPVTLVLGMLANKDAAAVLRLLAPSVAGVIGVPVSGHAHHPPEWLAEQATTFGLRAGTAPSLSSALSQVDGAGVVLIAGSLYLAGEALAANEELPT